MEYTFWNLPIVWEGDGNYSIVTVAIPGNTPEKIWRRVRTTRRLLQLVKIGASYEHVTFNDIVKIS